MSTAGAGLVLALLASPPPATAQSAVSLACGLEPGPTRAVAAIVDAGTVRLDDGKEVRLLGALLPRRTDVAGREAPPAAAWPPEAAAELALAGLVAGRSVALAFAGPRADRYGRVLAHLFLPDGAGDVWVQGRLVEEGHARAYALPESTSCLAALVARERAARAASRGLWAHAAYQIRPADRPTELARYRHTFQLVRGQVARVRRTRSRVILELASGERPPQTEAARAGRPFRIVWRHPLARESGLARAETLLGANVLVRGWIGHFHGPEIELATPAELERED